YKIISDNFTKETKEVINHYCKQNKPEINRCLRDNKKINEKGNRYINILDKALSNQIGENIITYRKVKENPFKDKNIFLEKGYMSTSLIDGDINQIHTGEYMLKILVPYHCQGFYVDYISSRQGEFEMLLKRNIKLKKMASEKQKNRTLILCIIDI
ncbi:ADP-ribosyltransferase, partial [Clostridioides sp. ZZV15-6597]|uniref:ADP-ribosyltransferase n=1 Tax=Clostridioides sp. ZZV15-6597 TaxID=2811500 RepID=UPI001D11024E|nr:hypothetical protein [Clostridioides sp. ZZV15-6597]